MNRDGKPTVDTILIYPKTGVDFGPAIAPPFSLLTIAAPLYNKGVNVRIIDQRVDKNWIAHLREGLRRKPICCGISTMTGQQIFFGIEAAKIIREETGSSVPIVWGGIHPTLVPEQTARSKYVDIVCVGEGDETFSDLVVALKNNMPLAEVKGIAFLNGDKFIFTGSRPFMNIQEQLPTPWDLVDVESYINPDMYLKESLRVLDIGQTSRGCPYSCAYCYNPTVHHSKWRAMSAEKVLDIIEREVKRFNLDGIWFRDDEFFLDINRVSRICEGIVEKGLNISWYTSGVSVPDILRTSDEQLRLMKRSGAHVMRVGLESGSNRVLKFMNKRQTVEQIIEINRKCKEIGFRPVYSLMFGLPTETFEEINQTVDLFYQIKEENPDASLAPPGQFTAFPGTPLYNIAIGMGLNPPNKFEDWADWLSNEQDSTGERLPWLNKRERRWISNLTHLSILAYSGSEILSTFTFRNKFINILFSSIVKILSKHFARRLKNKSYYFVPEVWFIIKAFKIYTFRLNKKETKK